MNQKKTKRYSLITIIKSEEYQPRVNENEPKKDQKRASGEPVESQWRASRLPKEASIPNHRVPKNVKNVKNVKEIRDIVEFLNKTLNKSYKVTTLTTQMLIRKRLDEGYTLDEFKLVIKNRKDRWENDEKMKEYLTPDTLFAQKNFEKYLQDAKTKNKKEEEARERLRKHYSGE